MLDELNSKMRLQPTKKAPSEPQFNRTRYFEQQAEEQAELEEFHLSFGAQGGGASSGASSDVFAADFIPFAEPRLAAQKQEVSQMTYEELRSLKLDHSQFQKEDLLIFEENKRFARQLAQNAEDPELWVAYVKFQDKITTTSAQALLEKKLSIVEKALAVGTNRASRLLALYHLRFLELTSNGDDLHKAMGEHYQRYALEAPGSLGLWAQFVDHRFSNFQRFSYTYFSEVSAQLFALATGLLARAPSARERSDSVQLLAYLVRKFAQTQRQIGFRERSLGYLQALIELNLFRPRALAPEATLTSFREFWESRRAVRVGDTAATAAAGVGWRSFAEGPERSADEIAEAFRGARPPESARELDELLRSLDDEQAGGGEDAARFVRFAESERRLKPHFWRPGVLPLDKRRVQVSPDCLVLFEDIEKHLVAPESGEFSRALLNTLAQYLGFPAVFATRLCPQMEDDDVGKRLYRGVKHALLRGLRSATTPTAFSPDALDLLLRFPAFADDVTFQSANKLEQLEFLRRTLLQTAEQFPGDEEIRLYQLALEAFYLLNGTVAAHGARAAVAPATARKNIKELLRRNESSLSLWVLFAEVEFARTGSVEEFEQLCAKLAGFFRKKDRLLLAYFQVQFYVRRPHLIAQSALEEKACALVREFVGASAEDGTYQTMIKVKLRIDQLLAKARLPAPRRTKRARAFPFSKVSVLLLFFSLLAYNILSQGNSRLSTVIPPPPPLERVLLPC